jgi:DNA-binding PadR family transcriptional regulator
MTSSLNTYEQNLLEGWESVYKKGQLTLWILMSLKDGPKHMQQIKEYVEKASNHTVSADDKSMYRSLRRYTESELIQYSTRPGQAGPDLKVYELTETGEKVLTEFVRRNIAEVYQTQAALALFNNDKKL